MDDKNKKGSTKTKSSKNYQPFVKVSDISSLGRSHRVFGHKTKRTHHLLSDLELAVFLMFEWHTNIEDIQEQFPLDINVTKQIADSIGVKHPSHRSELTTMTTDFYVISKNAKSITHQLALQAKYSTDLEDPRTIEKLEIERRYWEEKSIGFNIITEKDIPKIVTHNIKWLYSSKNIKLNVIDADDIYFYSEQILKNPNLSIINLCKKIDSAYDFSLGIALGKLRKLISQGYISFDVRKDYRKLICADLTIIDKGYYTHIDKEHKRASGQ